MRTLDGTKHAKKEQIKGTQRKNTAENNYYTVVFTNKDTH
jgi:hypothetical protein